MAFSIRSDCLLKPRTSPFLRSHFRMPVREAVIGGSKGARTARVLLEDQVDPIPTSCSHYYWHPQFFSPSGISASLLERHFVQKYNVSIIFHLIIYNWLKD